MRRGRKSNQTLNDICDLLFVTNLVWMQSEIMLSINSEFTLFKFLKRGERCETI